MGIAELPYVDRDSRDRPSAGAFEGEAARMSAVITRRAVDFMLGHLAQALSIGEIAAAAGTGTRTLHRAFARERGTTPMQFLRRARLDQVRADLITAEAGSRVSGIAVKWGFTHLGRFSREYRKTFGEMPSATLRRRPEGRAVSGVGG